MHIRKLFNRQKKIKIGILIFFCQNVCAQSFTLSGKVTGKDTGYAVLSYFRDAIKQRRSDTVLIKQGKFQFCGTITGADFAYIATDKSNISLHNNYTTTIFIVPGVITISFNNGDADKAVIKGSKPQGEYDLLMKKQIRYKKKFDEMNKAYKSLDSLLKNGVVDPKNAEEKRNKINETYKPVILSKRNQELSYINEHPNSYVSLILLYTFVGRLSYDSIDVMYTNLSPRVKSSTLDFSFLTYNSRYRKAIAKEYPFDKLKLYDKSPPFVIHNTLTGDSLSENDFMGQVVILEFWGIYCLPCLQANPILEEIRKKHAQNSIKIIALTNDDSDEIPKLTSYIMKNNFINWIHVSINPEIKRSNNLFLKGDFSNYTGLGEPRTVVIDKKGRIVYTHYGYTQQDAEELKSIIYKTVNENIK